MLVYAKIKETIEGGTYEKNHFKQLIFLNDDEFMGVWLQCSTSK